MIQSEPIGIASFGVAPMIYDTTGKTNYGIESHDPKRFEFSRESELADIILNPYCLKIVAMTISQCLSAKEIADNLGVSIVTSYNIVEKLTNFGLLVPTEKHRTSTHGKAICYSATVKSGTIELKDCCLEIRCNCKEGRGCFARNVINKYSPEENERTKNSKSCTIWVPTGREYLVKASF